MNDAGTSTVTGWSCGGLGFRSQHPHADSPRGFRLTPVLSPLISSRPQDIHFRGRGVTSHSVLSGDTSTALTPKACLNHVLGFINTIKLAIKSRHDSERGFYNAQGGEVKATMFSQITHLF